MPFDWTLGTLLPLALLAAGGALVPLALYRLHGPRLLPLALNLAVSTGLLVLAGAAIFAALYAAEGVDLARHPGQAALHFLGLGLSSALVWLPVLLLTGLVLGQRSEARLARLARLREAKDPARS
jgi:hypothetical protein